MLWPHLKILRRGKDNSAGDSERSKKEEDRRDRKITPMDGRERGLEIP